MNNWNQNPDSGRCHVSTSDPHSRDIPGNPWRRTIYEGPRAHRCQQCETCKTVSILGCTGRRDPNPCRGCLKHTPCWGTRPCERWSLLEESRHYSRIALQAYDNPSPSNRVDLLTQSPYRLDLESQSVLRLPYHPITLADLGPPPECLQGPWDAGKEYVMIRRMLGRPEAPLEPNWAPADLAKAEPKTPKKGSRPGPTQEWRSVPTFVQKRDPSVSRPAEQFPVLPRLDLANRTPRNALQLGLAARDLSLPDLGK